MASIFIRTLIIYILISVSIRIMGKRQIGELEVGELVSMLLVSEIAALPVADQDIPLLNAVIPLLFIVSLEIIISSIKNKSEKLKRRIDGEPIFIIYKGRLRQKALYENRISINEIICEMRTQGIGDISDVYYAILEQNGKLSFLKQEDEFSHAVIIDTETNKKCIEALGYDETWLDKQIKHHRVKRKDIFLMTVNDSGETRVIKKNNESN